MRARIARGTPSNHRAGHVRRPLGAGLVSIKDGPGPGAHDVRAADASQRAVWRQNKLASTASRFHADEIEAQRGAVGPSPADYDTYVPSAAPKATLVGREGLKSFSEAKIEEQKWTPGAGAYDTTTPLSQVGGALGREKRGGAFAGESDGPGPGVDAMPSFLASVAETHSVSLPGASHETPLPGAAAVLAARQAVGESPGPAYDTARAYNATHKAPGGISMRPQHLVATPLDRKKVTAPRFASPKAITARPPPAYKPPALPNAPPGRGSASRRRPVGRRGASTENATRPHSGPVAIRQSLRRRIHQKRASGRELGKAWARDAAAAPADARRRGRARGPPREKALRAGPRLQARAHRHDFKGRGALLGRRDLRRLPAAAVRHDAARPAAPARHDTASARGRWRPIFRRRPRAPRRRVPRAPGEAPAAGAGAWRRPRHRKTTHDA